MNDADVVEILMWVYIIIGGLITVVGAFATKVQDNSLARKFILCFLYGITLLTFTVGVTLGISLLKAVHNVFILLKAPLYLMLLAIAFYLPDFTKGMSGVDNEPDVIRLQCYLAGIIIFIGGC